MRNISSYKSQSTARTVVYLATYEVRLSTAFCDKLMFNGTVYSFTV